MTLSYAAARDAHYTADHDMNYLKSIAGTVLSSTGVSYPFTIGEKIPGQEPGSSIWELREGVKRVRLTWSRGSRVRR